MNAVVLGVSPDSVKSHRNFREKYAFPYNLLVDEGHKLAERYGIWVEKKLYGVSYMGVQRTTVIIDKNGRIAKMFPKVQLDGHVEAVTSIVAQLR
jgi:thioredoxin-dependent peroxiredoxin